MEKEKTPVERLHDDIRQAIEKIDSIIKASNGIMVARGDLGIEIPAEEVPLNQKKIVAKCKKRGIPVIIATQMMESMIDSLTPSRAEVNDVANSVMDGADAIMHMVLWFISDLIFFTNILPEYLSALTQINLILSK